MSNYLGYIILCIFVTIIIIKYFNNKEMFSISLVYCIIAPSVKFINLKLDSSYFLLIYLLILIIISKKKLRVNKDIKNYFLLTIFISFTYILAWLINSRENISTMLISIFGINKIAFFLMFLYSLDYNNLKKNKNNILTKTIIILTFLNLLAVLFQVLFPKEAYDIFSELYSSNTANYYNQDTSIWGTGGFYNGKYTRYFGLFENPMSLACYSLIAISYVVTKIIAKSSYRKIYILLFIVLLYIGFMSNTKTFVLGIVLLLIIFGLTQAISKGKIKVKLFSITLIILIFLLGIVFYNDIYNYLFQHYPNMAYYFSYISDPISALNTRFGTGNNEGTLSYVSEILRKNPLIGVGPTSVNGEMIGDNAYVVLIHNGGLIVLIMTIVYYLAYLVNGIRYSNITTILLILTMFIISMGLPMLIGANLNLLILYYLFIENKRNN